MGAGKDKPQSVESKVCGMTVRRDVSGERKQGERRSSSSACSQTCTALETGGTRAPVWSQIHNIVRITKMWWAMCDG